MNIPILVTAMSLPLLLIIGLLIYCPEKKIGALTAVAFILSMLVQSLFSFSFVIESDFEFMGRGYGLLLATISPVVIFYLFFSLYLKLKKIERQLDEIEAAKGAKGDTYGVIENPQ